MKKIFLILLAFFLTSNCVFSAIKISPSYVELDANTAKKDYITGSFGVSGGSNETVRFKVYPEFFEHDSKGRYISLSDKGQANSLMDKINYFPNEFTCANGKEQKVRFTINNIKALPSGESRLVLFLEDVDVKEVLLNKATNGVSGKIIVKTRVGVPIYLDKGNYTKKGNLDTLALKKSKDSYNCEYKVSSLGNSKIRFNGYADLVKGNDLIERFDIYGRTVQGGNFLETVQQLPIPQDKLVAGQEYKLKFTLVYKDENQKEKYLKKEIIFTPDKIAPGAV
jgi:hypothetical protein